MRGCEEAFEFGVTDPDFAFVELGLSHRGGICQQGSQQGELDDFHHSHAASTQ
jgi:hypothetical protein